ncbi:hypothetical protein N9H90_08865 [Pseudomonadales bacterium]|nr:hypothetical protein [Pseudomonadales bacterium]
MGTIITDRCYGEIGYADQISYTNPSLDPLVYKAINPLGLTLPYYKDELRHRSNKAAELYVLTMEAAGITPNIAMAKFGVIGGRPNVTWEEAQFFVSLQNIRQVESFDRFIASGAQL